MRPAFQQRTSPAIDERAACDPDAGRVLELHRQQMALVEVGGAVLGLEVQPVLRECRPAQIRAGIRRRIVDGLGQRVLRGRGQAVAQPATHLQLAGMA